MCSYFKNLWSLSPSGDGLRVTSVALVSQILFAPLRLGVLAIKNETQSRKDANSQSSKSLCKSVERQLPLATHHRSRRGIAAKSSKAAPTDRHLRECQAGKVPASPANSVRPPHE